MNDIRRIDRALAAELIAGSSDAPPLVLAHGVTQNRTCWGEFAGLLGRRFAVWAVDLPGHGDSGHDTATFDAAADLLADTIGRITAVPAAVVVGYSMGGRLALRAVLDHPDLADRLVLIGATAGLDDPDDRAARRAADAALADRLRIEGPERFLDDWLSLPLFADLAPGQHLREQRLRHWGSGVAETFEHRGTGSMEPLWGRLHDIAVPTLVLAGADDHKFLEIGERLVGGLGISATLRSIAGSGHACHLAAPVPTAEVIVDWVSATPAPTQR